MHAKWILLAMVVVLSACGTARVQPTAAPVADVVNADAQGDSSAQAQRPVLSTEVLPSLITTVTLKAETPVLQRPKAGSVIMKTLAAGDTVQLLGVLDNADGQWRSVSYGDTQGWVRAAQVTP